MTVGHRYTYRCPRSRRDGLEVLVMSEGGGLAVVREVGEGGWLGQPFVVEAKRLEPAPMRYFSGAAVA